MKKLIAMILTISMLFTFTACNKTEPKTEDTKETSTEEKEVDKEEEKEVEEERDEAAIVGSDNSVMVGSYTIDAEWIPIKEPHLTESLFNVSVVNIGDNYYMMTDKKLKQYSLDDDMLVFEKDIELDDEYEIICKDENDILYVSSFMRDFIAFDGDKQIFSHSGLSKVAMHPSGKWGISWFSGAEVDKVIMGDGTIKTEEWEFKELENISNIVINKKHIFVNGRSQKDKQHTIFVYDLDGKLVLKLGGGEPGEQERLGSIADVVETKNGFIALDGNMRELCLWKPDGTFIGKADAKKLTGTAYPVLSSADELPDGSILIALTQEREDKSARELLVYKISGF